jgi:transcriptional antiterminator RfaH
MNNTDKTNEDTPWWVVQTKPRAEFTAMQHLENQGLTLYCPLFKKEYIRGRQLNVNTYPLFPRYVFVEANPFAQQNIHVIRSTFGVSQLLKIREVPTKISCQLIYELKQIEAEKFDETLSEFNPGDHVKIKEGLYKNLEAVYQMDDGFERAVILLSIINKETPLRIEKYALQKA